MFSKIQRQRNVTAYNLVFEDGGKFWFPFTWMPFIGSQIVVREDGILYNPKYKGTYIVTKIDYEICTTEQWSEISNYVFIHVKQIPQVRTDT